jgi:acylphosphatase
MIQEKSVANTVNAKLITSGHPIAFKARIQGSSVNEGDGSIGAVVNTAASVLNDVTIHAQKGRRKTNVKKLSKM